MIQSADSLSLTRALLYVSKYRALSSSQQVQFALLRSNQTSANMMSNAAYRTTNHQMMDMGMSAAQLHRQQASSSSRRADAPGYRTSANISVDCNSNNGSNETTSTATTSSERSSQPQLCQEHQQPRDPSLGAESVMRQTKTNFGKTQIYMQPANKEHPYRVGTGSNASTTPPRQHNVVTPPNSSPATERRQQQPTGSSLPIPSSPFPDNDDESLRMDQSPAHKTTAGSILSTPPRTPLDTRRLQFYDSPSTAMSLGGVESLIPFDQVWNNQEFELGEGEGEGAERNPTGVLPLDETPEKKVGGASAFSAVSSSPPPAPPPPTSMTPTQKARLIINARFHNRQNNNEVLRPAPNTSTTSRSVRRSDPPEVRHFVPTTETPVVSKGALKRPVLISPNGDDDDDQIDCLDASRETRIIEKDDDIPSDEDETKQRLHMQQEPSKDMNRDKRHLSLATASRRKKAEDVGHRMAVEDLSSQMHCSRNYDNEIKYNNHRENRNRHSTSYNTHEEEETTAGGDDDSIFDFKEQMSRSQSNGSWAEPSGRRAAEEEASLEDDDYYLQQHSGGAACLKTRAQEAFAYRRRFPPKNKAGISNARASSPRSQQPRTPLPLSTACGNFPNSTKPH